MTAMTRYEEGQVASGQLLKTKPTTPELTARCAEVLAKLEDNNWHAYYAELQACWQIPEEDILAAYKRLGIA